MQIMIRPESADDPKLMPMLKFHSKEMVAKLLASGIEIPEGTVKIWIKRHRTGRMFPKVEFDACGQELQYDLTPEGEIKETHFKAFDNVAGPIIRRNIDKSKAHPVLRQIDDILRPDEAI